MKTFIITSTILTILEIVLLTVCYVFYVQEFSFSDYMNELYDILELEIYVDSKNNIIEKFQGLFNSYKDMGPLGNYLLIFFTLIPLIITYIFLISFMITYLYHFANRTCCKCKKTFSYIAIIFAAVLSIIFIAIATDAKTKIDLTDEEIYQFDDEFNEKTRKNINFMKRRKIILIVGASLLYAVYITHLFFYVYLIKRKLS